MRREPRPIAVRRGLADILRTSEREIITAWSERLRTLSPARELSAAALIDHMPHLLRRIADHLDGSAQTGGDDGAAALHSLERLAIGFDLQQLVQEYALLRATVFDVCLREPAPIDIADLKMFDENIDAAVASAAATYASVRERLLRAVDRISEAGLESPDLETFLQRLLDTSREVLPAADVVVIFLRDGDALHVRAAAGISEDVVAQWSISVGERVAGRVAREARALAFGHGAARTLGEPAELRAIYAVPLVYGGEVIGVAQLASQTADELAEECKLLFSTLASRATLVIQHALLVMRDRASSAAARAFADTSSMDAGIEALLRELGLALHWDVGCAWRVAPRGDILELAGFWSPGALDVAELEHATRKHGFRRGEGLPGRAWERGETVYVEDLARDPAFPRAAIAARAGLRSGIGFPVIVDGNVVAVIEFFTRSRRWSGDESVYLTNLVSEQLAQFTRRIAAQEEVRKRSAQSAAILEAALDAVVSMDAHGRVSGWNAAAERLFGHARADAVGRDMAELIIPPKLRDAHRNGMARFIATRRQQYMNRRLEMTALRSDGTEFPVELTITQLPGEEPPVFTGFLRDLTERTRIEEERLRLLGEAERAARQREHVLAVVSHDLRNPLGAIVLSAGLLAGRGDSEPLRKQLGTIQRAAGRMERLIDDLLDMASIQSGRLSIEPANTDVVEIIGETSDAFEPAAQTDGISIRRVLPRAPITVRCDRHRIVQALSNILGNAVKYTGSGDTITVSARIEGRDVIVTIADTGPGIGDDELPHIFDPYWTVSRHGKKGTGLGLFITKGIVEAHGGRIWATSAIGVGTTFHVALPIAT